MRIGKIKKNIINLKFEEIALKFLSLNRKRLNTNYDVSKNVNYNKPLSSIFNQILLIIV